MKKRYLLLVLAVVLVASFVVNNEVFAVSRDKWQAGRIIDDSIFTKKDSMSAAEIQAFLNSKVGTSGYSGSTPGVCDSNGTSQSELGGGTRAQYAAAHGYSTTFTCLKDYYEVPKTSPGPGAPLSNYGGVAIPSGAKSAAQLIWDAAQQYSISPRVLLVKLHTESAGPLTTDDWPLLKQYNYAMGAHCPDSGPNGSANCDVNYAGFSIQISESAALMRYYLDNMTQPWWSYKKPYQNNNILWNVATTNCGSSPVYIQNKSTAALYTYTPYQPNDAALNNLYGSGDSCSAYGNRNFWRIFSDWFGGTTGADYSWQLNSQEIYSDAARLLPVNTNALAPNTDYYFRVRALNTGNSTWTNSGSSPVLLATTSPSNRTSPLCDTTWLNCSRPAGINEASVLPGTVGTFEFKGKLSNIGSVKESFSLVAEGKEWFNDIGMYWQINATSPTAQWTTTTQVIYRDAARTTPINIDKLAPNTTYYASITARNTGNTTWSNTGPNPVRLGTSSPQDRASEFYDSSWISSNRIAALKETSVAPGDVGTFEFILKSPSSYKTFNEYFRPVVDGQMWMNDVGMFWPLTVAQPTAMWSVLSQMAYTNNVKTTTYNTSAVVNNSRLFVSITARNTGNTTWSNTGPNPVRLGTSSPQDRASEFYDSSWISSNRIAALKETSVAPGDVGTFEFWVTAPSKVNGIRMYEYFRPVVDGQMWMNDVGMYQPFTFSSPDNAWLYSGQSTYSDSARTSQIDTSLSATRNTIYYLKLQMKNTSGQIWSRSNFSLGTSNPHDRASQFYNASWASANRPTRLKETSVEPGQVGTFEFNVTTPNIIGDYQEFYNPVIEGKAWLVDIGLYWPFKVR